MHPQNVIQSAIGISNISVAACDEKAFFPMNDIGYTKQQLIRLVVRIIFQCLILTLVISQDRCSTNNNFLELLETELQEQEKKMQEQEKKLQQHIKDAQELLKENKLLKTEFQKLLNNEPANSCACHCEACKKCQKNKK